jgi:hypothetical protein
VGEAYDYITGVLDEQEEEWTLLTWNREIKKK